MELIITFNFEKPFDEGGTIQLNKTILQKQHAKIYNWGNNVPNYPNSKVIQKGKNKLQKIISYTYFLLVTLKYVLLKKPKKVHYYPMAFPNIVQQIHANIISRICKNTIVTTYQTRKPTKLHILLTRFTIQVQDKSAKNTWGKKSKFIKYIDTEIQQKIQNKNYDKNFLRKKYKIPQGKKVALHIGHWKEGRGIEDIINIAIKKPNILFLFKKTSRTSKANTKNIPSNLKIINDYIDDIYELYYLADVYLFLIQNKENAIDSPLSIYEALDSKLPIICRNLSHLRIKFKKEKNIVFVSDTQELSTALEKI